MRLYAKAFLRLELARRSPVMSQLKRMNFWLSAFPHDPIPQRQKNDQTTTGFNDLRQQPLRTTIEVNRAGKDRKLNGFWSLMSARRSIWRWNLVNFTQQDLSTTKIICLRGFDSTFTKKFVFANSFINIPIAKHRRATEQCLSTCLYSILEQRG